jgi:3-hydroxybutyrate dehydrogenase
LSGKTALITGSTQGLGLAAAERFAESGCNIVFNGFAEAERMAGVQRDLEDRLGVSGHGMRGRIYAIRSRSSR